MELIARKEDEGQRLDKFISSSDPSLTRSAAVLLIENGAVTVGGKAEGKVDWPPSVLVGIFRKGLALPDSAAAVSDEAVRGADFQPDGA